MVDSDELLFGDDEEAGDPGTGGEGSSASAWQVLLVDDEPDVHAVTRMALSGMLVDERPVEILSAYSSSDAAALLAAHDDIALAILDVVMEHDAAGLDLARDIRAGYPNKSIRIVLRTGQPGLAPEEKILRDYDINDYWTKTELASQRMRTLVTGSIRSCRDLRLVEDYSRQLEQRNLELQRLKEDLERIVTVRTMELRRAKRQLEDVNAQLAKQNADLSETAERDSLSGLINHGTFLARLDRVLTGFDTEPVALILLDLDHFKRFNDENGHPAGDAAIRAVARLLDEGVRGNDFAARCGGEEFALVLHDCDLDKAAGVAERVRAQIADLVLEGPARTQLTASFGVTLAHPGEERESLVWRADQAMYASKRGGRNRVTSQDEPEAELALDMPLP